MSLKQLLTLNRWAAALSLAALTVLLLGPFQGLERVFGMTDVVAHALAFYALSLVAFTIAPTWRRNDLALAVFAFGALIEFVQSATGRSGSLFDLGADGFGIGMAMLPQMIDRLRQRTRRDPDARVADLRRADRRRPRGSRTAPTPALSRVARRAALKL